MSARCRVSWKMEGPSGAPSRLRVTVEPMAGGSVPWGGRMVSREPVAVLPDPEGRYEVDLVPSSAVGLYRVRLPGSDPLTIRVPDARAARLLDCIDTGESSPTEEGIHEQ